MQLEFLPPPWSTIYNFSSHYCFKFSVGRTSSSSTRTLWCVYTWLDVRSRCCHLWYTVGLVKSCSQEVTLQPNRGHTTQSRRSYTLWCSCSSFQIGNTMKIVHHFIIIFFYLWYCIKKFGNPWVFILWNCPIVFSIGFRYFILYNYLYYNVSLLIFQTLDFILSWQSIFFIWRL